MRNTPTTAFGTIQYFLWIQEAADEINKALDVSPSTRREPRRTYLDDDVKILIQSLLECMGVKSPQDLNALFEYMYSPKLTNFRVEMQEIIFMMHVMKIASWTIDMGEDGKVRFGDAR